jgi:hypothetical protein
VSCGAVRGVCRVIGSSTDEALASVIRITDEASHAAHADIGDMTVTSATSSTSTDSTRRTEPPPLPPPPPPKVEPAQQAAPGSVQAQWNGESSFERPAAQLAQQPAPQAPQEKPGFWGNVGGFFKGAWDGAVDTVKGVGNMAVGAWNITGGWATNPEQAAQSWQNTKDTVSAVAQNPGLVVDAVTKPITDAWSQGKYGEAIGRGTFEAASVVLGAKGLDKIGKLGKVADVASDVARTADKVADVAKTADKVADVATAADKVADASKVADKVADASKAADKVADTASAAEKAFHASTANGRAKITETFGKELVDEASVKGPNPKRVQDMMAKRPDMTPASLDDGMKLLGENPTFKTNPDTGKVIAYSKDGKFELTADANFGYYRIKNMQTNQYVGLDGKVVKAPPGQKMTPQLQNQLTHFRID